MKLLKKYKPVFPIAYSLVHYIFIKLEEGHQIF